MRYYPARHRVLQGRRRNYFEIILSVLVFVAIAPVVFS